MGTQEKRNGRRDDVSYVASVELKYNKMVYSLQQATDQSGNRKYSVFINDVEFNPNQLPYNDEDNGVRIQAKKRYATLSTDFGLTLKFNGKNRAIVKLCSSFADKVCGLCGNADGKKNNDFVDREGKPVEIPKKTKENKMSRHFLFGSEWKVDYDGTDIDGSSCKVLNEPNGTDPEENNCNKKEEKQFNKNKSCGALTNLKGPFKNCLQMFKKEVNAEDLQTSCVTDMCEVKGNQTAMELVRCTALENLWADCMDEAQKNNKDLNIIWRKN